MHKKLALALLALALLLICLPLNVSATDPYIMSPAPPLGGPFGTVIGTYQEPGYERTWVWTGYNPSITSYSWTWTTPNPEPGAGDSLDLHWVNPLGLNSYVIWDMGSIVAGVRVYPTQDHLGWDITTGYPNDNPDNVNEFEYHEYWVYVSNDLTTWTGPLTETYFWLEGYNTDPSAIADDAVKDYDFGGVYYRYVKIMPRYDKTAWYKGDYEIDAVQALYLHVEIDIKPDSYPNSINLGDQGLLPVAILGSATFDVETIHPETIEIGGISLATRGSAKAPKLAYSYEDVDGDGYTDLIAFFSVPELVELDALTETTTELRLTATLCDGTPIEGTDSVRVVPP